jgi:hypothetical protein
MAQNFGAVSLSSLLATLTNVQVSLATSGSLTAGTLQLAAGTTLSGSGLVNANVVNAGRINVGDTGVPGILTINGDYTQASTGVLHVEIGGILPGSQYGRLQISGQATLDGTLDVRLINGYTPAPGTSFEVLTFDSRTGTSVFASRTGDGSLFGPNYSDGDVTLVKS